MVIPFLALVAVIVGIVLFSALAGNKKVEGNDLGDPGVNTASQPLESTIVNRES